MALLDWYRKPDAWRRRANHSRTSELISNAFLADASGPALLLLAGLPVVAAISALLLPDKLVSREMTWDLLFNLAGGWHIYNGHVPHLDFHEPVGELNFMLTAAGFHLIGLSPQAFLIGVAIVAVTTFAAASFAAWRRLPLVPAVLFVLFACLLVLMPANLGDQPNAYSFAMSYNRYGWSALIVVALILFVPPRNGRAGDWWDTAIVGVLLLACFHIKITYFAVGVAMLALAIVVSRHVSVRRASWSALGILLAVQAFTAGNAAYVDDLLQAVRAGAVRGNLALNINYFLDNAVEYGAYFTAVAIGLYLYFLGRAPFRLAAAALFLIVAGVSLISQNSQSHGMPLGLALAFLIYDALRRQPEARGSGQAVPLLAILLIFPLLLVMASSASLAGYYVYATREGTLRVVDRTNLRGLAVPIQESGLLAAYAGNGPRYALLNRTRSVRTRYELTPYEYVETLLEAAAMLSKPRFRRGPVVLLDQVNPLPFMLRLPPPRGGNLWSGDGAPLCPPEQFFADAMHVLIPKYSTFATWTEATATAYGQYLSEHFRHMEETSSWILVSRERAIVPSPPSALPPQTLPQDDPEVIRPTTRALHAP